MAPESDFCTHRSTEGSTKAYSAYYFASINITLQHCCSASFEIESLKLQLNDFQKKNELICFPLQRKSSEILIPSNLNVLLITLHFN